MARQFDRKIVLEDGSEYLGYAFGAVCDKVCEIVFDTSMVGYQEIVSDPSYTYQAVVMTYPLIGNYGMTDEDYESRTPTIGALICREYNENDASNFRSTKTLAEWMEEYHIPGIFGMDTRKLARSIRDHGSRRVLLCSPETKREEALQILAATPVPTDAVAKVSCKKIWYSRTQNARYNVVAVDCGIRLSAIRSLNMRGCNVTVVPYNTPAEDIVKMKPNGIFLSNGPGNPKDVPETVALVRALKGKYPIFGVCLGHQLISLAYGADTAKMKFGHRGTNHPVKNLETESIGIAAQNHGYTVLPESVQGTRLSVTHVNLLDQTVEGIACPRDRVFGVQFYPESAPGLQVGSALFDQFVAYMREDKQHA